MANSDGSIIIDTRINSDGFNNGIRNIRNQTNGLTKAVVRLGTAIGSTFAIASLINFGKTAVDLGSDLQEVQNVVDVTFSTMNEAVNEFARNAAETAGLSETMAKKYTGTFGAMAKAFGFAEGQAFDMATSLTQLSGDVASFYNLTQDEAYTKLKSVFTGETESLKDLGVVMTQTALDSFAMAEGYGKTTKQMTEQEKVALRYAFVLDQLSSAQGDFVRTSDSWANQTRILSLNFDSFKANIGQALINIFTPFLKVLNQIVDKMAQLSQRFVAFSEMLVGKSTSGGGGSPGVAEQYEEIANNSNMASDSVDGFSKSLKKASKDAKQSISPLDNLNNITVGIADDLESAGSVGISDIVASDKKDVNNLKKTSSVIDRIIEDLTRFVNEKNWSGLGEYLSNAFVASLNFISEKLDQFDWEGLGEDIGDFIAGINWLDVIKSGIKLKFNIWKAIAEVWFGMFDSAPIETAIITSLAALKFTGLGAELSKSIAKAITGSTLVTAITNAFASLGGIGGILTMDMATIIGAGSLAEIGIAIGTGIIGGIIAAIAGWNIGQELYEFISGEEIEKTFAEQMGEIIESFKDGSWKDAIALWGEDIKLMFSDIWDSLTEKAKEKINILIYIINMMISSVTDGFNSVIESLNSFDIKMPEWLKYTQYSAFAGKTLQFNIPKVTAQKIPYLATGAVIPPNAPFMAMLGDQRNGRNLEAPEGLIRQIMREEMAQIVVNVTFEVEGDEAGIFGVTQRQAAMYTKQTGKPAYPTGG